MSRAIIVFAVVQIFACAKEPARDVPSSNDTSAQGADSSSPSANPSQSLVLIDAGANKPTSNVVEGGRGQGGTTVVAWEKFDRCAFNKQATLAEGKTAKDCCKPTPDLELCLETTGATNVHEVGPLTEQKLIARDATHVVLSLPLDRSWYLGKKGPPEHPAIALTYTVSLTGLSIDLHEKVGCKQPCPAGLACSKDEKKIVAEMCESAGKYTWDGQRFTHTPPAVQ